MDSVKTVSMRPISPEAQLHSDLMVSSRRPRLSQPIRWATRGQRNFIILIIKYIYHHCFRTPPTWTLASVAMSQLWLSRLDLRASRVSPRPPSPRRRTLMGKRLATAKPPLPSMTTERSPLTQFGLKLKNIIERLLVASQVGYSRTALFIARNKTILKSSRMGFL